METRKSCWRRLFDWFSRSDWRTKPSAPATKTTGTSLKVGGLVRVRSKEDIQATLSDRQDLQGCKFVSEMWPYCGTTQRVFKRVERFLDERDLRVKKCSGIVLLEGLMCRGSAYPKGCDRSCFFLWREEWLERIDVQKDA
jgi:hypothetical protein